MYRVTNNINNKIYVGVHKTKSLDDGYMGSGKIIRRAIAKHGLSNFSKVILETFDTSESMYAREAEVVDELFLLREDVYNLKRGGNGGFDFIDKETKIRNGRIGGLKKYELYGTQFTDINVRQKGIASSKLSPNSVSNSEKNRMLGTEKARTKEVNDRRKSTFKDIGHQQGNKNSQYGLRYICNETGFKKVKVEEIEHYLNNGWQKGQKLRRFQNEQGVSLR